MSDTQTFSFTGTLSVEEAIYLHIVRAKLALRPTFRICLIALFAALFLASLAIFQNFNWNALYLMLISLTGFYWLFLHTRLSATLHCRKHAATLIENTAIISSDRISLSNADSGVWLRWKAIHQILNTPKGLIFMLSPTASWFFLPEREFEQQNSKEGILKIASEQSVTIRTFA